MPPLLTNTELTADDVLDNIANAKAQIKLHEAIVKRGLATLDQMREEGLIGDTLVHPLFTLKRAKKETWYYSPAVKSLQGMEQLDGTATKKTSHFWKSFSPKKS